MKQSKQLSKYTLDKPCYDESPFEVKYKRAETKHKRTYSYYRTFKNIGFCMYGHVKDFRIGVDFSKRARYFEISAGLNSININW